MLSQGSALRGSTTGHHHLLETQPPAENLEPSHILPQLEVWPGSVWWSAPRCVLCLPVLSSASATLAQSPSVLQGWGRALPSCTLTADPTLGLWRRAPGEPSGSHSATTCSSIFTMVHGSLCRCHRPSRDTGFLLGELGWLWGREGPGAHTVPVLTAETLLVDAGGLRCYPNADEEPGCCLKSGLVEKILGPEQSYLKQRAYWALQATGRSE